MVYEILLYFLNIYEMRLLNPVTNLVLNIKLPRARLVIYCRRDFIRLATGLVVSGTEVHYQEVVSLNPIVAN